MTDGQLLLAVFTAFYLVECLHWLPLHSVVLHTWASPVGWAATHPSHLVSAGGKGLALAWPLPPLGSLLVAESWPVIPDAQGLWVGAGQLHEGRRLEWNTIDPHLDQRTVNLTADTKVQCTSRRSAERLMELLRKVAAQPEEQRPLILAEFWLSSLSIPRARAAVRQYRIASSALRLPCLAVFFMCFVYMPLLFWRFGGSPWRVVVGVASLLAMTAWVAIIWRHLALRLFPDGKRRRWAEMLHLIFIPAHAMRAHDEIGAEALAGLHPLAAASAVLKQEALETFAAQTWLAWKFRHGSDALLPATAIVLPHLEACCRRLGIPTARLETPPAQQGGATSYCPRCHAQFSLAHAACGQCGDIPTRQWPAATAG